MVAPRDIEGFVATMPPRYTRTFASTTIEQHARTSHARGRRPVNVGLFSCALRPGAGLSVIAPDRPGLLAIIGLAFDTCGLDIIEAEVFTRHVMGSEDEAVDLFWVRRKGLTSATKLSPAEVRQLRDTLVRLLQSAPKELLPPVGSGYRTPAATGTLVRFLEDIAGRFATLEIETNDRTGLMLGVCQALFHEGIQIVGSRIKAEGGRVKGRFEVAELTERPIEQARRHVIKLAVLHAVDNLKRDTITEMVG